MKPHLFLFSIFLFISLITPSFAATLSISDLHMVHNQKYDLYEISQNETVYLGEFNATDAVELQPQYDYHLVAKPDRLDWISTIYTTMDLMTSTEGSRFLGGFLVICVFGGAFLAFASRMWA